MFEWFETGDIPDTAKNWVPDQGLDWDRLQILVPW
jgi:hypothetical protein